MVLPMEKIASMIDISAVRTDSSDSKVCEAVDCGNKFGCYLITVLPSQVVHAKKLIKNDSRLKLGGNVGFPSGGQTTYIKVQETKELVKMGVDEIDMVIDVAALISERIDDVYRDIAAVVEASDGRPVKTILECHYLSDSQIILGCDQAMRAGASFVKTGTGWAPTGATIENITLIKKHVGDAIRIKASGGIRDLDMINHLSDIGVSRFGISAKSVKKIFSEGKQS
jgi:deoxyribose-phosphate aldolase